MSALKELYHPHSKSCCSYSTNRPQSAHSSRRTFLVGCDAQSSDSCIRLGSTRNHTVEIHEENVVNIDLPPLMWFGYNKIPKILSATNTGRTILINGQWACGRPYISGGPLNGSYIFSQIHFHSPSEHEIDGRRYPLEMHVVHYKNCYLTQERAMKEKDGTIVLVYLFQIKEGGNTIVSEISKNISYLEKRNSRAELCKIALDQIAKPFNSNYYTYRSSVPTDKNCSYLLQWIISCNSLCVTRQEVEELLCVINFGDSSSHLTGNQPENDIVFRVGEEDYCERMLSPQTTENPCSQEKKGKSKTSVCKKCSKGSVCKKSSKASVCKKCSEVFICKKCSKASVCKKCSEVFICKKCSKESVCKKCSKGSVCKKSSKTSVCKKCSKMSVCKKCSEAFVCKKCSKGSVCKKCSKTSACRKCPEALVCDKCSKASVCEEYPKNAACENSFKKSVCEKPSKKSVSGKSSKKSVCKKSSKKSVGKKSSKTSIKEKCSETSVDQTSSNTCVNKKTSKTTVSRKTSETSVGEKSSETSCRSVKEKKKKTKERDKSKSTDSVKNPAPCCSKSDKQLESKPCSKSDVKEKKQKPKKSKDVCVTKEESKSKSVEKCSSQGGTNQTSVKKTTSSTNKETAGDKKLKKKSTESKISKAKGKKSSADVKEKCAETRASKSTGKLDCSEANVKMGKKRSEKITTIYEKKQKGQSCPPPQEKKTVEIKPTPTTCDSNAIEEDTECVRTCEITENNDDMCDDVQINYIFLPNTSSSVHSNIANVESDRTGFKVKDSFEKADNTTESEDFIKFPSQPIINHALVKAVKFPVVKSGRTKHVYLHTKHIFRTEGNNKEFTPQTFQECHILIERDRNVLQEYSGTLYPNQLSPGNYEQLNLSARYSDAEDIKIHATECIAKLESLQELSIRAKFLISETYLNGEKSETLPTHKQSEEAMHKKKSFSDAQCQCEQPLTTTISVDTKFLEEEVNVPCKSLVKWDLRNLEVESLDFKKVGGGNLQNLNSRIVNEVCRRMSSGEKNLKKVLVEQNGAIKLMKNPNTSGWGATSKDLLEQRNEREAGKAVDGKSSMKSLKNSLNKPKKTTYFVYDRIEKDNKTGKKIFVGSFRTRDEIEVLYKHRNIFQNDRIGSDLSDRQNSNNGAVNSGNEIWDNESEKFIRVEEPQSGHKCSTSKEENQSDLKKEVITLHKFEPKHFNLRAAKNKSKNIIVGKISNKVDAKSEKYSQLADMLGLDKSQHPKISFYEFQESKQSVNLGANSKFDVTTGKTVENSQDIDKDKVFPSTSDRSDFLDGEYSEGLEGISSTETRPTSFDKKDSQAAVVVIPIEVDSLSKIEIVLIEHTDDVKKSNVDNKYNSYLKQYKRLILKLNVYGSGSRECYLLLVSKTMGTLLFFA